MSYSVSHNIIAHMVIEYALNELVVSKKEIEPHLDKEVSFILWSHEATNNKVLNLLPQAGYRGAILAGGGIKNLNLIDLYNIKRIIIVSDFPKESYPEYLKLE